MLKYLIICLVSVNAYAGGNHNDNITNIYPTETVYVTEVVEVRETLKTSYTATEEATGTALAIATGQLNFDFATDDWQIGAGLGNYQDDKAGAIGVAKRFGGVLINGSYGKESNSEGYGLGATIRFK